VQQPLLSAVLKANIS